MSEEGSVLCLFIGGACAGVWFVARQDIADISPQLWPLKLALFALPVLTIFLPLLWRFVPSRLRHAAGDATALTVLGATTVTYLVLWPFLLGHTDFAWVAGTVLFFIAGAGAFEEWVPEEPEVDHFAPLREPIYGHSRRATTDDLARAGHAAIKPEGSNHAGYLESRHEPRS